MAAILSNDTAEQFNRLLASIGGDKKILPENREFLRRFVYDGQLGKTVTKKSKKKLGCSVLCKYVHIMRRLGAYWKKPFDKVSVKDMERLIIDLEGNRLRRLDGKPMAAETRHDYKKTIKKFYKWLCRGVTSRYVELTGWIDTSLKSKEVSALSRKEIEQMAAGATLRNKMIIMLLFDSGARIQELLNVRIKDLTREKNYYKMRISHEFTKTKGRTISVPLCTELLDLWLRQHPARTEQGLDPEARLIPMQYAALRKMLARRGRIALNKKVHPHLLRHSSATYYAHRLNQYQLCYRYGWSMSSTMPERYIDRAGIREEQTAKVVIGEELHNVSDDNKQIREELVMVREQNRELAKRLKEFQEVITHITKNPDILSEIRAQAK